MMELNWETASYSYFGNTGILVAKWPCKVYELPIQTVDEILTAHGTQLPYPRDLVITQIHHTKGLTTDDDTIIPNVTLEFSVKNNSLSPIYPIVCQIMFSQSFQDAQQEVWSLANAYPSLCMAIIIDVVEDPPFKFPVSRSTAWKVLSQDPILDYVAFVNYSSLCGGTEFMLEPLVVTGHLWCSVKEVVYHVWVKAADSDQLDVDGEVGDHYAFCTSIQLTIFVIYADALQEDAKQRGPG